MGGERHGNEQLNCRRNASCGYLLFLGNQTELCQKAKKKQNKKKNERMN